MMIIPAAISNIGRSAPSQQGNVKNLSMKNGVKLINRGGKNISMLKTPTPAHIKIVATIAYIILTLT